MKKVSKFSGTTWIEGSHILIEEVSSIATVNWHTLRYNKMPLMNNRVAMMITAGQREAQHAAIS